MNALLSEFWELAGAPPPPVRVVDADDVLPSALATTDLAVGSVAAAATAAAALAHARGGPLPMSRTDGRRVSAAFRSDRLLRIDGRGVSGFAEMSRFWPTTDGWVRTHGNYPHHRSRLLAALGLPDSAGADDVATAMSRQSARQVEDALAAAGAIGVAVRTAEEWRADPHAAVVDATPLVAWRPLATTGGRRLERAPSAPLRPMADVRVLDLTRVIAGPVATRTLALLGADVLRIDSPRLPEISWQYVDTGMGKRSTLLDLDDPSGRASFEDLLSSADVVVTGYRPGALTSYGLDPAELAERRPGVVVATLSAWGDSGPWGGRRGFDSIVQAATGIALAESADGATPGALPAQALDHATGYLLAAAVMHALARQLAGEGSLHVQMSLVRTAHWLLDAARPASVGALPAVDDVLMEKDTPAGRLRYPSPAVQVAGGPDDWTAVGGRWGADAPVWSSGP
ncbi:MAG TPA: CoA transferase [Mycobacteriales bacterium]|nr:CoA transferase [Mycobacteriales bacterium]